MVDRGLLWWLVLCCFVLVGAGDSNVLFVWGHVGFGVGSGDIDGLFLCVCASSRSSVVRVCACRVSEWLDVLVSEWWGVLCGGVLFCVVCVGCVVCVVG